MTNNTSMQNTAQHARRFNNTSVVVVAIILLLLFAVSLIPPLYVSFFTHPVVDDYSYGLRLYRVLQEGGNVFDLIGAAFSYMQWMYRDLSGLYSQNFLATFQPAVFNFELYYVGTWIMLGLLICSTSFLIETFFTKYLKISKWYSLIITILILFLTIQYMPSIGEGIFWFNGACNYTAHYSFMLISYGLLIRLSLAEKKSRKVCLTVFATLLSFAVSGANWCTSLFNVIVLFFVVLYCFIKKKKNRYYFLVVFLICLMGFLIAVCDPGNAGRDEARDGFKATPPIAIITAIVLAGKSIIKFTGPPQIIVFLFISPILYSAAKKSTFSFKYPFFALGLLFGIYASEFAATSLVFKGLGPTRAHNVYYYTYFLIVILALFYLYGWIEKKREKQQECKITRLYESHFIIITACFFVAFGLGVWIYGSQKINDVNIINSIQNGTVQQYDNEYREIKKKMEEATGELYLPSDITTHPDFLWPYKFSKYSTSWPNTSYSEWYGLDSIICPTGY